MATRYLICTSHCHAACAQEESSSWLQLDRSASSSFLQHTGYSSDPLQHTGHSSDQLQHTGHSGDQLQHAGSSCLLQHTGYSSGTGGVSGYGNMAADNATTARKRKGGRPRVYDLDQPIPSGTACVASVQLFYTRPVWLQECSKQHGVVPLAQSISWAC